MFIILANPATEGLYLAFSVKLLSVLPIWQGLIG